MSIAEQDVKTEIRKAQSASVKLYNSLVLSGVEPGRAAVDAGLVRVDHMADATLEELMFQRILHPKAKIYSQEEVEFGIFDPEKRQPGELTSEELYRLVDMMHYDQSHPITYVAKTLSIPLREAVAIKTELSKAFYEAIRQARAEDHLADYMRQSQNLMARARHAEQSAPAGHANRLSAQRLQWDIQNKILDRQQELGVIPKNLGQMKIQEEYIVEVRAGGVVGNKRQELKNVTPEKQFPTVEFCTPEQAARVNQIAESVSETAEQLDNSLQNLSADDKAERVARLGDRARSVIDVEPS